MGELISAQLDALSAIIVKTGGSAALLSIAVLALINMWAIIDPRMGQMVKGALLRVAFSLALLGICASGAAVMKLA
jgi:hypothetical protein